MLRICRAEDGELFQVDATIWDIESAGNLELFLEDKTGVHHEAILAYLSDGSRLMNANVRDLDRSQDGTIYVFNKLYLDYNLHEVLRELRVEPRLQPTIEDTISSTPPFRPSQLAAASLQTARFHRDINERTASSILLQHESLSIASRSLDLNILSLSDAFDAFAQAARRELDKQAVLLSSLDSDLEIVGKVKIHPDFLSSTMRRAVESGEAERTLGSYVANDKMRQVADGCAKLHEGLKSRFDQAQECMVRLREGSDQVRATLQTPRIVDSTEQSRRRSRDAAEKITDLASKLEGPVANSDDIVSELKQSDVALRNEVENITDIKNMSTELCISALRRISALNVDLVQLPALMSSLQADFRVKTSFSHIQRLHNMLYAYGATLVEIVRRREFSRFFYQRAQTILEVMAKLSSAERKRRQIYRGEVHGQLPFQTKDMNDAVPMIDFSPSGGMDVEYSLDRSDVEAFMQALYTFEKSMQRSSRAPIQPFLETRQALEKLISRMDGIELTFDRIVERSLLSASRLSSSRRRLTEAEEAAMQELSDKVTFLEKERDEREAAFAREKEQLQDEIARLKRDLQGTYDSAGQEREVIGSLEREVHSLKAQNESDAQVRRVLEQRHNELLDDIKTLRKGEVEALESATYHAEEADRLRQELARTRAEYKEVKELETRNSQKIAQLIDDQTTTLRNLEEARSRGEDLQAQIQGARAENDEVNRALRDAGEQKDRLLRAQALEHDRIMRDHIAEADGDRAVLEQQFFEVKALLDENERHLKEARSEIEVLHADAAGLREELQRTEHELREARHIERVLRTDLSEGRASQSDFEQKINDRERLVAQILDVAIAFRDSHAKAFGALQPFSVHPALSAKSGTNPSDSLVLSPPALPMSPLREELNPIDPMDPAAALDILRSYDLDAFSETVTKVGSVVRRLQKQCKEYRERSKGKITFRNFAKGDLALFLPTRNSVTKPWAAFNVSFPHYFLNAAGRLAEQLKTREWIVARITSIAERIADSKDPGSNPYGLGDGVKYYMLEVEDWTRPGSEATKRRKSTPVPKSNSDRASSPPPLERPISPPLADHPQSGASAAEPLGPTRSPNSHLFPVRTRSNSTSAGPSSLSRLLAQATPVELPLEPIASSPLPSRSRTPSPSTRAPGGPPPPSPTRAVIHTHSPSVSSPLRPGSRASGSSSSRLSFSGGRIAPFPRGTAAGSPATVAKAAPTTALSSDLQVNSPPTSSSASSGGIPTTSIAEGRVVEMRTERRISNPSPPSTPSPTHSASEGMTSVLQGRRRTTSEHVPASSASSKRLSLTTSVSPSVGTSATSALANFVEMTMSMGRRKKPLDVGQLSGNSAPVNTNFAFDSQAPAANGSRLDIPTRTPASELLKRF